jgi:hypothetical protein
MKFLFPIQAIVIAFLYSMLFDNDFTLKKFKFSKNFQIVQVVSISKKKLHNENFDAI